MFFFNDTATTEIYTLSLHDALPIFVEPDFCIFPRSIMPGDQRGHDVLLAVEVADTSLRYDLGRKIGDRKSTRLNSSHANISYAVFCLKKNTPFLTPKH